MKHLFSDRILRFVISFWLLSGCVARRDDPTTIRIRWAHDPETLDPLQLASQQAIDAVNLLHLGLLQTDFSTQRLAPALATALPEKQLIGDSLTRFRYRLRPAAAWDNGRPVLAHDVAFTLKLMFCPGLPNETARAQYGFVRALLPDPTDPRRFTLECRGQSLEYLVTSGDYPVLSEAALDPRHHLRRFTLAELQRRPTTAPLDSGLEAVAQRYRALAPGRLPGCGPYQLITWERDRLLVFRRKPRWWADQLRPAPFVLQARPTRLEFAVIPNATTARLALQSGDLDVFPQVPGPEFARLRSASGTPPTLALYESPSNDVAMAWFNTRRPALADAPTRRALSRCFDAAGLLRATQFGKGQRTVGIISPADRRNYNDSLALLPFDPTGAAALLQRAGWRRAAGGAWFRTGANGERQALRLRLRYRADEVMFGTVALQFQAAAAGLGIAVALLPTESGLFSGALRAGDFDVYLRTLRGNPFMFNFMPLFHSRALGAGNTTGFSSPASDRLLEAVVAASTPARKARLLRQFQAMMQREAPVVPLFFLAARIAADRRLRGLHVTPLKPGYAITALERAPSTLATP